MWVNESLSHLMLSHAKKGAVAVLEGVSILERLVGRKYIQYLG